MKWNLKLQKQKEERAVFRTDHWKELWTKRGKYGNKWILGGNLNDIRNLDEKRRGRVRTKPSCKGFLEFIENMNTEEIEYQ